MNDGKKGIVYLVGAGPGHPKLITVRGMEVLQQSDAVVYDRLASPLLLKHMKPGATRVYVGKLPDRHTMKQEEINKLLVELALEGKTVTRLKGGDPSVFGRVGEEAEQLARHGIEFEIVPGITSASAVPAYAGIPVTHRDYTSSFTVITGHEKPEKLDSSIRWDKVATASDTLVFLMGVAKIRHICSQLIRYGRDPSTPVALVRWGTRAEQETLTGTLETIADLVEQSNFRPPATIIVGDVVRLRECLAWFEHKPLFGLRVLVTRARKQESRLSHAIEVNGGEAVECPVLAFREVGDPDLVRQRDEALTRLDKCDWIIFTSVNGVDYFFDLLIERGIDVRSLQGKRIVAIGPQTAEVLKHRGIISEPLPPSFTAPALAEFMEGKWKSGESALLPRGNLARDTIADAMSAAGVEAIRMPLYETYMPRDTAEDCVHMLEEGSIHVVTFTSSSTVTHLCKLLENHGKSPAELLRRARIACIGPVTADTAREAGLHVDIIARQATIPSLVEAIIEHNR